MKLDLPEAFGPISTFSGVNSMSWLSGPNERKLFSFKLLKNLLMFSAGE
jgi:hypothetical protein